MPIWGTLPPNSEAARRALATITESDVITLESFFETLTQGGKAPKAGGEIAKVTAREAKVLFKQSGGVEFNVAKSIYVSGSRQINSSVVKAAAQAAVNQSSANIGVLATRATSGSIQAADLFTGVIDEAKRGILSSISLARGGPDKITDEARERGTARLLELIEGRPKTDEQRGFLGIRKVCEAYSEGKFDKDLPRLGKTLTGYSNPARIVYENENSIVNREAGRTLVCRILAGAVKHCPSCLEVAARGYRENDGSDPIGGDFCQDACYCTEVYKTENGILVPAVKKSIESAQAKLALQQQLDAQRMKTQ